MIPIVSVVAACLTLMSCSDPATASRHKQSGYTELFNDNWVFMIDSTGNSQPSDFLKDAGTDVLKDAGTDVLKDTGSDFLKDTGTDIWEKVSLPHTPRIEPLIVNDQWQGDCWYRKEIVCREEWKEQLVFLRFEGAMNVAEVWIDDLKKTTHLGGYLPFTVDLTEDLVPGETRTLWVKVNNEDNPLTGPKPLEQLDFNMYGGLYRDVFLVVKNKVHITDEQYAAKPGSGGVYVTFPRVTTEEALVSVQTHLKNSGDRKAVVQVLTRLEKEGTIIAKGSSKASLEQGADQEVTTELVVADPALWSPGSPSLYELHVEVMQGNRVVDSYLHRTGIREFSFRNNKLYINGAETFLRGVNRHQEYPYIGYALSNNANYRDALKIKEAGFDYVRLSHYPHTPAFLDACDELGIVTINPVLGWQYYNPDPLFREYVMHAARGLIRRDRNHACVLAWEVSLNESRMPEEFIDTLVQIAREEYPGEGCYTAGWLPHGYDIYLQARQHRLGHGKNLPDKPYIVSEYGDWEYYAMNAGLKQDDWNDLLPGERSSRQLLTENDDRLLQQARNIQEAHNDNFSTPAVADGYWVMFDYNRGYADDLEASGIMSIFRQPKFSYYFFQSQRDPGEMVAGKPAGPMVYIASRLMEERPVEVKIYSNCEEVELIVNGKSMGTQAPDDDRISSQLAHPPFTFAVSGVNVEEIIAVGKIGGEEQSRDVRRSPGNPASLRLTADISGRNWKAGCNDVLFIYAHAVDEAGNPTFAYEKEIRFSVTGDAEIIGGSTLLMEKGMAAILVRAGETPGEVTVTAVSGALEEERLVLETTN